MQRVEIMQSIRITGLCLIALFVLSATAAVGASAAKPPYPEFFRCEKAPKVNKKYTGEFSNKDCTVAAAEGKYRLKRVEETPRFTLKGKSAIFTVEGKVVECGKSAGSGELHAFGWVAETVTITFSKCDINKNKKAPCENIAIKNNSSEFYYTSKDETEAELSLGVQAFNIKCGNETFEVGNAVLGAVKNSRTGETITFEVSGGKQALRYEWSDEKQLNTFPKTLESLPEEQEVTLQTVLDQKGPKGVGVFF